MKGIITQKQFDKFLKSQGTSLKTFITRYQEDHVNNFAQTTNKFGKFWKTTQPSQVISSAFHWGATMEGFNFWSLIDIKWNKILEDVTKEN